MSRSGYSDDCEYLDLYRGSVDRALSGQRGQRFLRRLRDALEAMPVKRLERGRFRTESPPGVCALGAVLSADIPDHPYISVSEDDLDRMLDYVNCEHHERLARDLDIARCMVAEIEYVNDEGDKYEYPRKTETPEERWNRVFAWVTANIKEYAQ